MRERIGARLAPALLLAASAAVAPATAQESCATAECHAALLSFSVRHEAAESCDTCHTPTAERHPEPGVRGFELAEMPPALCAQCHDVEATAAHVHPPFARGSCTVCHSPHASNQPKLLRRAVAEVCRHCHADPAAVARPHGPVTAGDCTACHAPHQATAAKLLVDGSDRLCFRCHAEIEAELGRKTVHGAIAGGCTSCHQPHGAEHPKLLAETGAALCGECHSDLTDRVAAAAVVHPPLADARACANCHAPHAADHAKLLAKSTAETCAGCHRDVVPAQAAYPHAPVADGDCTACHDPHASASQRLFPRAFPAGRYAPYDEGGYALCFECHDAALARFPDTSFATGFRDGERNLHFVHVNDAQKGRTCVVCHAVHGSANPALIATRVPFGEWSLPLGFAQTATGGSCAPGCHAPRAYDRKSPVSPPPAAEPGAGAER